MMNRVALFCVACVAALHGFAADTYYLKATETLHVYNSFGEFGFVNPLKWVLGKIDSETTNEEFDPTATYIVRKNSLRLVVRDTSSDKSFLGGCLQIGEKGNHGALLLYATSPYITSFDNQGLRLVHGCILCTSVADKTYLTDGDIVVDTYSGKYTDIAFNYKNSTLHHQGNLSVLDGKTLTIGARNGFGGGLQGGVLKLSKVNSLANSLGTIEVISNSNRVHGVLSSTPDASIEIAQTEIPGTLTIGKNCRLKSIAGGRLDIVNLTMENNTWLDLSEVDEEGNLGGVVVSQSFELNGKVIVTLPDVALEGKKVAVLTAPKGTEMSLKNFYLKVDSSAGPCWFTVEEEEDKTVLYVNYPDVLMTAKSGELGVSESWSEGESVQPNKDYALRGEIYDIGETAILSMPKDGSDYTFSGNSLTVGHVDFRGHFRGIHRQNLTALCCVLCLAGCWMEVKKHTSLLAEVR